MVRSIRVWKCAPLGLVLLAASAGCLLSGLSAQGVVAPEADASEGMVRLDVSVTGHSGSPVRGLKAEDFNLLDNGEPRKLVSFHAYDENANGPDAPVEVMLVIDGLNLSSQQVAVAEREAERYLRTNGGKLAHPVMVYRLSDSSLTASQQPSLDGNALAEEVASGSGPRSVWARHFYGDSSMAILRSNYSANRNLSSLWALGAITTEAKRRPGRKLLLWISPGWPVEAGGENSFDQIVEFSTRLREARISLNSMTAWPYPEREFAYEQFLKGPTAAKNAGPGDMALEVLATKSGGRVMPPSSKLAELIGSCVEHAGDFYTLTFDPPRAAGPDEYHELKVTVGRPDVSVSTNAEYYDQPTFYDEPPAQREQVAAARLPEVLQTLRSVSDSEAARRLAGMDLTERLSAAKTAELKSLMHGQKAREQFTALAERSAFLLPPAAEIPNAPMPDVHDQRMMLERMINYVRDTIPNLPNLSATRTTVRYEEPAQKQNQTWKTAAPDRSLHPAAVEAVTVLIRNSKEITEANEPATKAQNRRSRNLVTEGTFGPILAMVVVDAADPRSQLEWSRWEQDGEGKRAVFRFTVPREISHFEVGFCCLADPDGTVPFSMKPAYHGEITIDPDTGSVLRIAIEADLPPRLPMLRSDILVEYGQVVIGGRTYICPTRSVSMSRSRTVRLLHAWGAGFGVYGPFETILNDVTFSDYHLFRSEHRMLTDVAPVP